MTKRILIAFCCYLIAGLFSATALADDPDGEKLKPGKIKLVGRYKRVRLKEGKKQKTYFVLPPDGRLRLKAGGPTAFVLLARGYAKGRVSFDLDMDGEKNGNAELRLNKRFSRSFYVKIPQGTHAILIEASGKAMVRPVKKSGKPRPKQLVVAWQDKKEPSLALVPLVSGDKEPPPEEPQLPEPPPLAEAEEPARDAKEKKAEAEDEPPLEKQPPAPAAKRQEEKSAKLANGQEPAKKIITPLEKSATGKKQPRLTVMPEDLEKRPVEVRLRVLADRLAAGLAGLPGQGRYERLVVARFAEHGEAAKDMELGTIVTSMLNTFLKRDHGYLLLERERLVDVLKEMEMAMAGLVDPSKAARVGKMLGAQAIVVGSVSQVGDKFTVNARLVSAESASVLVGDTISIPRAGMVALSDSAVVLRSRGGAVFRSLLVPGWGQFYNQEPVKGGIIIGTEAALIGSILAMHFLGYADEQEYNSADFALRHPDLTPQELGEKAQSLRESAEDYYQTRNILIYAAVGVYLYNVLDAYLFGVDGEEEAGLDLVPTTTADSRGNPAPGMGLGFSY